jgi:hypothetical protein
VRVNTDNLVEHLRLKLRYLDEHADDPQAAAIARARARRRGYPP